MQIWFLFEINKNHQALGILWWNESYLYKAQIQNLTEFFKNCQGEKQKHWQYARIAVNLSTRGQFPSFIYSRSISYILEHEGTWILLFGLFGQLRAVMNKNKLSISEQLLRLVFSTFWGQFFFFFYCSVRTIKLHKIKLIFFF